MQYRTKIIEKIIDPFSQRILQLIEICEKSEDPTQIPDLTGSAENVNNALQALLNNSKATISQSDDQKLIEELNKHVTIIQEACSDLIKSTHLIKENSTFSQGIRLLSSSSNQILNATLALLITLDDKTVRGCLKIITELNDCINVESYTSLLEKKNFVNYLKSTGPLITHVSRVLTERCNELLSEEISSVIQFNLEVLKNFLKAQSKILKTLLTSKIDYLNQTSLPHAAYSILSHFNCCQLLITVIMNFQTQMINSFDPNELCLNSANMAIYTTSFQQVKNISQVINFNSGDVAIDISSHQKKIFHLFTSILTFDTKISEGNPPVSKLRSMLMSVLNSNMVNVNYAQIVEKWMSKSTLYSMENQDIVEYISYIKSFDNAKKKGLDNTKFQAFLQCHTQLMCYEVYHFLTKVNLFENFAKYMDHLVKLFGDLVCFSMLIDYFLVVQVLKLEMITHFITATMHFMDMVLKKYSSDPSIPADKKTDQQFFKEQNHTELFSSILEELYELFTQITQPIIGFSVKAEMIAEQARQYYAYAVKHQDDIDVNIFKAKNNALLSSITNPNTISSGDSDVDTQIQNIKSTVEKINHLDRAEQVKNLLKTDAEKIMIRPRDKAANKIRHSQERIMGSASENAELVELEKVILQSIPEEYKHLAEVIQNPNADDRIGVSASALFKETIQQKKNVDLQELKQSEYFDLTNRIALHFAEMSNRMSNQKNVGVMDLSKLISLDANKFYKIIMNKINDKNIVTNKFLAERLNCNLSKIPTLCSQLKVIAGVKSSLKLGNDQNKIDEANQTLFVCAENLMLALREILSTLDSIEKTKRAK